MLLQTHRMILLLSYYTIEVQLKKVKLWGVGATTLPRLAKRTDREAMEEEFIKDILTSFTFVRFY